DKMSIIFNQTNINHIITYLLHVYKYVSKCCESNIYEFVYNHISKIYYKEFNEHFRIFIHIFNVFKSLVNLSCRISTFLFNHFFNPFCQSITKEFRYCSIFVLYHVDCTIKLIYLKLYPFSSNSMDWSNIKHLFCSILFFHIISLRYFSYFYHTFYGITGDFSENAEDFGVQKFKSGFNAHVEEYIGDFIKPVRPILYKIYTLLK